MRWVFWVLGGLGGAMVLWGVLLAGGWLRSSVDPIPAAPFDAPPQSLSIAALGTSLTADYDWPAALGDHLSACLGLDVRIQSVAQGGRTSKWGLAQVDRVLAAQPDIVLAEFTANDADLRQRLSPGESLAMHEEILARIFAHAPTARVLLLGTNPVYGLRGLARPRMQTYLRQYAALAARDARIGFVDLAAAWREAAAARSRADVLPDGLHPDRDSARSLMVAQIAPIVANIMLRAEC